MSEYQIERISESNLSDLIPIYQSAFGNTLDLNVFKKKQSTYNFGDAYVGFIAYDNQHNPAAFYGVYTCEISYNGNTYRSAQSGDTMTHKDHAGKGLFTLLATKTYEYCKENGFHLVFGFPNENSFPGFIKRLGWSHFDDLTPYVVRVKCIPWIRLKNTFHLSQSIHNKWCIRQLAKLKKGLPFKSSCYSEDTPVVNHSEQFFSYKTYEKNYLIDVKGISVWLKFDDTFLIIGDIEKCPEQKFLEVIKALKRIAFCLGLPHLRFHASSHSWGEEMFKKYGTPMDVCYPVGGINFSNEIPMEKMKFTAADNDTF
jgi:GNAT superfamily N-acetyltransferase